MKRNNMMLQQNAFVLRPDEIVGQNDNSEERHKVTLSDKREHQ